MIKRSFFGIAAPRLNYDAIEEAPGEPVSVAPGSRVTLFIDAPLQRAANAAIKPGDPVLRGQRLQLFADDETHYAISPVSGKIAEISPFIGMMEKQRTAVVIDVDESGGDEQDTAFKQVSGSATLEGAARYLQALPGKPDFFQFTDAQKPVKTIAVLGTESDLLSVTGQYVVNTAIASVKSGIDTLRKISGIQNIVLVVHQHMVQVAGASGAGIKSVDMQYPAANREMIRMAVESEQGREGGIAFFTAEAAAAVGAAYNTGRLPLDKLITVVKKDGSRKLASVPIGTHLSELIKAVGERVESGDRVVTGGPMTGQAIYSLDQPVEPDTDIVMIQDKTEITEGSDTPCTNCGECVRICPVNVPVNILVRFMDAGQYEQAAESADLFACIDCGLCAYVCESRIPICQFISLAKHAVTRMKAAEEENA